MANYKIGVDFEADGSKAVNAINQVAQAMQGLQNQVGSSSRNMQGSFDLLSSSLAKVTTALGAYLSINAIGGVIKSSLQASASLEQASVSFEVFTGSAKTASELMQKFKEQALKSPMQFQDIVQGGKTLMNYGITAEQVTEITRMLGDVSGGNADRFNRLALAFGQVNGAGRLMGQELRQMINAGFNPLQTLSESTGESMASLTKRMHDGQISVREVAQAFIYATSEGGRFFENADKQSQTLTGAYNKMKESITFTLSEIGTSIAKTFDLSSVAVTVSNLMGKLAENFTSANGEIQKSSFWSNLLKSDLADLAFFIDIVVKGVKKLASAFENSGMNKAFDDFSNWLDNQAVKLSGVFGPKVQGYMTKMLGLYKEYHKIAQADTANAPSMSAREKALAEQNARLRELLKSFSDKPAGMVGNVAKESNSIYAKGWNKLRDTIFGTDFVPKTLADDYKRLIKLNEDAGNRINAFWDNSTAQKLITLDANYKKEIAKFQEFNAKNKGLEIDYTNVTKQYEAERLKIVQDSKNKLLSARNKARDLAFGKDIIARQIKDFQDGIYAMKSFGEKAGVIFEQLFNQDFENNVRNYGQAVYNAFKDFNINLISGASQVIGNALATGQSIADTFKAFGSMILDSLGDALIRIGTSAIAAGTVGTILKSFITGGITTVPELGIAGGMAAVAVGTAMKALSGKVKDSMSMNQAGKAQSSANSISQRASGSSYQYGGSSYATQSIRLSIDLTGAITASPTGYNINKSLETVLRVTGR